MTSLELKNAAAETTRLIKLASDGKRIVMVGGVFDIIHAGHVQLLRDARNLGDILVVAIPSDEVVSSLKGPGRPLNAARDRVSVLCAIWGVYSVLCHKTPTPIPLIELIHPAVFVKGGDYREEDLPETPVVKRNGGVVKILPYSPEHSTTKLIERIRSQGI